MIFLGGETGRFVFEKIRFFFHLDFLMRFLPVKTGIVFQGILRPTIKFENKKNFYCKTP